MSAAKLLLGIVLLIVGLYSIVAFTKDDFWIVVKGLVPPLIAILGAFIVWLEVDEMKLEREIKRKK